MTTTRTAATTGAPVGEASSSTAPVAPTSGEIHTIDDWDDEAPAPAPPKLSPLDAAVAARRGHRDDSDSEDGRRRRPGKHQPPPTTCPRVPTTRTSSRPWNSGRILASDDESEDAGGEANLTAVSCVVIAQSAASRQDDERPSLPASAVRAGALSPQGLLFAGRLPESTARRCAKLRSPDTMRALQSVQCSTAAAATRALERVATLVTEVDSLGFKDPRRDLRAWRRYRRRKDHGRRSTVAHTR